MKSTAMAALVALAATVFAVSTAAADNWAGRFHGASQHETRGTVTITETANGTVVTLGSDFFFDGAPDPKLAFGNHRTIDKRTIFAPLRSNTGQQTYRVPAGIDPADFSHFYVWCERFSVPLGLARMTQR